VRQFPSHRKLWRVVGASLMAASAVIVAAPGCSGGDDFTKKGSGGSAGASTGGSAGASTGGSSGDSGTTGGTTSTGGTAGTATGGASGSGGSGGGTQANGTACAQDNECQSGHCADGFCCDSACDGACTSCKLSGSEGTCSPYTSGTDPEGECIGTGSATDPCAGKCDGAGACDFPSSSTACGSVKCVSGTQTGYACDGTGACKQDVTTCAPYACGATTCLSSCSGDGECDSSAWCDGSGCQLKKDAGLTCAGSNQCKTGFCEGSVCCKTACASPATCNGSGDCKCGTETCGSGVACINWYQDADGDTYGNPAVHQLGCDATSKAGWSKNNQDCYDNADPTKKAKDAHPGQTGFFMVDRGDGSFDYNCDNSQEHEHVVLSSTTCKICACTVTTDCAAKAGFGCSAVVLCPSPSEGFASAVSCGQQGTLYTCGGYKNAQNQCVASGPFTSSVIEGCR